MKNYIILVSLFLNLISCVNKNNIVEKTHNTKVARNEKTKANLSLIKDNLYIDREGNLFLKSRDISGSNGKDKYIYDVWIDEFSCGSCRTRNKLKSIIDIKSFELKKNDHNEGGEYYEDCKHTYFHKWMSDGGVFYIVK
jgi:hypothetical protein